MINYGYIQWLYSMVYSIVYSMVIPSQWYNNQWRRAGLSERPSFRSGAPSSDESMRLGSTGQMSFRDGQDILFSCLKHRENHGNQGKMVIYMENHKIFFEWVVINYCLVVTGTMEFRMTFHNRWECHHPNWRTLHHFSHGLKPTTNQRFSWDVHGFWWTWWWTL